jgi:hypothetical protein
MWETLVSLRHHMRRKWPSDAKGGVVPTNTTLKFFAIRRADNVEEVGVGFEG